MAGRIARRDFLKVGPVGVGGLLVATRAGAAAAGQTRDVRIGSAAYRPVADYPIRPQRFSAVVLRDGFWKPKVAVNADVTIPLEVNRLTDSARGFGGNVLEAAIMSLETHPNPALQAQVDARVRELAGRPAAGNGGFEVAAGHFRATGRRDLVDPAVRSADALYREFVATNPPFSGGERDAQNCVQLYRVTGDKRHLDLAKHYLDIRGLQNSVNRSRHNQSYRPVLEQREAVGHAVNGTTLMVSMMDVGILTGLKPYVSAAQQMWRDAVTKKMYITGGIGTTGNEGFGEPWSLPNISAYAETCAVLMFITLSHRLFLATGDSQYIDVLERGMYNNALCGVSATGDRFFYVNRLASAGDGRDERWARASLECCPPNLVRFLASMPGLVYAQDSAGAVYVNLYVSSESSFDVAGRTLALSMDSDMPWGGRSRLTVTGAESVRGAIKLRIPGWARNQPAPGGLYAYAGTVSRSPSIRINGAAVPASLDRLGYVTIHRTWTRGDAVEIDLPVETRWVAADDRVKEDRGRMAIERGPIVYCAESHDAAGDNVLDLLLDPQRPLEPRADHQAFGGVTVLGTSAGHVARPSQSPRPVTLVPYYLWANRGRGTMTVWFSTREYAIGDIGPAGGFIFHINPNWSADGWRYLEAAPFDQSAGARWGCFRRAIEGARGTEIGTGRRNTADILAACPEAGTAARLCADLSVNGVTGWFLPSRDELAALYKSLQATGIGVLHEAGKPDNVVYWSSSQQTADMANHVDFADLGRLHYDDKDFPRRVRAVRVI